MRFSSWTFSPAVVLLAFFLFCQDAGALEGKGGGGGGGKAAGVKSGPSAVFSSSFGKGKLSPRRGRSSTSGGLFSTAPGRGEKGGLVGRGAAAGHKATETRDVDCDIDADVDICGNPYRDYPYVIPEAMAYAFSVPPYAMAYGVNPGYYSWYYPPRSTASVTYVSPGNGATRPGSRTVIVARAAPTEGTASAPVEQYPTAIASAVESLNQQPDAAQFMRDGTRLFRERDYAGAAEQFRRAIPFDIDNGLPRFSYAHALFAAGDYANASYNIRRGLDLMPEWVTSGNNMRALYDNPTDFEDQRAALGGYMKAEPNDYEAWVTLGYVEYFGGNLEGAERAFRLLAEANSEDPIGPHFLAEIEKIRQHLTTQEEK